ncbi:hypothetical protein EMIHUDRAFT_471736, partial [Emiliania huxleyi CCMP1516]|uniref:Uncharacterized protein n=2 Tax=Emiliania huxleyi TaxID=2903 RepID=A0A0D3J686_EMIH1
MEDRADEGMGPRNKRVIAAIEEASFTGKGDKPVVVQLYRSYARKVNNAMVASGEKVKGEYEGERNAAGEREGRGVFRFANGNVYDGEWKAGKKEGRGVFRFSNGNVYDGEWKAGEEEGRGVHRWANGDVETCFRKQRARVDEGVSWMADGRRAVRLRDGEEEEEISLEEARRTAERLGLPIPSPLPGASELVFGVEGTAEWLSALTVRCTGFTGTGTPTLDVVDDDDGSLYARVQQHTPGHVLPPGPGAPFLVQDIRGDVAVVRGRWTGSENFTFTVEDLRPGQNNTYSGSWVGGQDSKLHLHDTWGIAVDLKKGEVSFSFKNKKHAGVHPASPVAVHLAVALAMVAARSATQPDGKTAALIPCREGGWILGILGNREARDRREREEAAMRQKLKLLQYSKAAANLLKHMSEVERPMVREAVKEIFAWVGVVSDIATKEDFEGKLTEITEKIGTVVA